MKSDTQHFDKDSQKKNTSELEYVLGPNSRSARHLKSVIDKKWD
jgi:hypothetical protein